MNIDRLLRQNKKEKNKEKQMNTSRMLETKVMSFSKLE